MQHDILFIRLGTGLPQWLKVCLLLQETRVQSLVQEDSICHRQLSPCATNTEACLRSGACAPQSEKPAHHN